MSDAALCDTTCTIPLTRGKVALINAADYCRVAAFKWHAYRGRNGVWYAGRHVTLPDATRPTGLMHRYFLDAPAGMQVDHRNGDGLDNRRSNIRLATNAQNAINSALPKTNKSGYRGVFWHKRWNKWQAQAVVGGRSVYLGLFSDPIDAAIAYDTFAREHFGAFARLNFAASELEQLLAQLEAQQQDDGEAQ